METDTYVDLEIDIDDVLLEKVDLAAKNAELSRDEWINKALKAVLLALASENSESEHCSGPDHTDLYSDCQSKSNFESLG